MPRVKPGITLIESLAVLTAGGLVIGIMLPAVSGTRAADRTKVCQDRLSELANGWTAYAKDHDGVMLPGRMYEKPGGKTNEDNWYDVGNGMKYRPRWAANLGPYIGVYAFSRPSTSDDRQDYEDEVYVCPQAAKWSDERNHGYGYNHQFLGNARQTAGRFHNYPVQRNRVRTPGRTVVAADSMGTAAGFPERERLAYENDSRDYHRLGNHAWSLDPPRLTQESDRGSGDPDSPRTAVDPRHDGKANVVFADGHGDSRTTRALGYLTDDTGRFVDHLVSAGGAKIQAKNRLFSGTGRDESLPPRPQ